MMGERTRVTPTGLCSVCGQVVVMLKNGNAASHYAVDTQYAYNNNPDYYCRGSSALVEPLGDAHRTVLTVIWHDGVPASEALSATRNWAKGWSEFPGVFSVRVQTTMESHADEVRSSEHPPSESAGGVVDRPADPVSGQTPPAPDGDEEP